MAKLNLAKFNMPNSTAGLADFYQAIKIIDLNQDFYQWFLK